MGSFERHRQGSLEYSPYGDYCVHGLRAYHDVSLLLLRSAKPRLGMRLGHRLMERRVLALGVGAGWWDGSVDEMSCTHCYFGCSDFVNADRTT